MDKNIKSEISVLMPVYNGENYLKEAIDSILTQSISDFEFIIIDDGSTDKSIEIVQSYHDTRIKFFQNKKNTGIALTLNRGLALASGKYIARMDQDDISLPNRLAEQYNFMQKNPDVILSGAFAEKIGADGAHLGLILVPDNDKSLRTILFFDSCFVHPLVFFDRVKALSVGGYSEPDHEAEDYGLWVKMAGVGKLANLNKILLKYRWSGENISIRKHSSQQATVCRISYWAINSVIGGKLTEGCYKQFWYYWKNREGTINLKTVKELMPLWDFAADLPCHEYFLVYWLDIALSIIRSGNILAGLCLLDILDRKFNLAPSKTIKARAIFRGIINIAG